MSLNTLDSEPKKPLVSKVILSIVLVCIVFVIGIYVRIQCSAPSAITEPIALEVTPGMTVRDIADEAQRKGLVRSDVILYAIITYSHDPTNIYAGTFVFEEAMSVFKVAEKLASNNIEKDLVRLTIPEGMRLTAIAETAEALLPDFVVDDYLLMTDESEGYLFPETYFIPKTFTASDLISLQKETYEENIEPLRADIKASSLTEYEVLTLASIVEREANDEESMAMVAGILLNRLAINMALQADASIEYIFDTPLNELPAGQLASELRETQSPYNTYLNTGLPPTPIGNPGTMAITAVVHPTPSENFFYITDDEGTFHYAKTFAEHNRNIDKYLR